MKLKGYLRGALDLSFWSLWGMSACAHFLKALSENGVSWAEASSLQRYPHFLCLKPKAQLKQVPFLLCSAPNLTVKVNQNLKPPAHVAHVVLKETSFYHPSPDKKVSNYCF